MLESTTHGDFDQVRIALHRALAPGEYGSVFVESARLLNARFTEGHVTKAASSQQWGSATRRIRGTGAVAFGASNEWRPTAIAALLAGETASSHAANEREKGTTSETDDLLAEATRFCEQIDAAAREFHSAVTQVLIDVERVRREVAVVTPDAVHREFRTLEYFTVRAICNSGNELTTGFYTPATSGSLDNLDPVHIGRLAARRAVDGRGARPAPIATVPVVVAGGRGMVLIHEACCHPIEGDEVVKGSIYSGGLGSRIAAPELRIADDSQVPGAVGSYGFDDEGELSRRTPLVEDGLLVNYLTDVSNGVALGRGSSGNGRVDNFKSTPLPRMSNTVVGAGRLAPEQVIEQTEHGIYAEVVGGGEVVEATGEFVFRVLNGRMIENGQLTDAIQETTIGGNGKEVLRNVDMIASDVQVGAAQCGKHGQYVPVGVIGPTLRISGLRVGGTER